MDIPTIAAAAAIVSAMGAVASAAVAIAALIHARQSEKYAERSSTAAEHSASIARDALALQRQEAEAVQQERHLSRTAEIVPLDLVRDVIKPVALVRNLGRGSARVVWARVYWTPPTGMPMDLSGQLSALGSGESGAIELEEDKLAGWHKSRGTYKPPFTATIRNYAQVWLQWHNDDGTTTTRAWVDFLSA